MIIIIGFLNLIHINYSQWGAKTESLNDIEDFKWNFACGFSMATFKFDN